MKSLTTPEFWEAYAALPTNTQARARKAYRLWGQNPRHGSLQFEKKGRFWRVRVSPGYRALAYPYRRVFCGFESVRMTPTSGF